jgi:hypothetical protein
MSEVTRILSAIEHGDPHAADQLLPLIYAELRQLAAQQLAQENRGQTRVDGRADGPGDLTTYRTPAPVCGATGSVGRQSH